MAHCQAADSPTQIPGSLVETPPLDPLTTRWYLSSDQQTHSSYYRYLQDKEQGEEQDSGTGAQACLHLLCVSATGGGS